MISNVFVSMTEDGTNFGRPRLPCIAQALGAREGRHYGSRRDERPNALHVRKSTAAG